MKKITAIIIALAAILTLSACQTARTYRRAPYTRTVTTTTPRTTDYNFGTARDEYRRTTIPNATDMPAATGRTTTRGITGNYNFTHPDYGTVNRGIGTPYATNNDGALRNGMRIEPVETAPNTVRQGTTATPGNNAGTITVPNTGRVITPNTDGVITPNTAVMPRTAAGTNGTAAARGITR